VAPFISIISAEEFARAEAVAPLLICQLNVTENTRGGGVDLAQVFSPLPPNAFVHPTTALYRLTESLEENIVLIIPNLCACENLDHSPCSITVYSSESHVYLLYNIRLFSRLDRYPPAAEQIRY